ncbi:MAG TPA: hypothetical protein PJ988_14930, partial [Anaerolinea sp.]|nr:hypothetical protein [Anaerolinea sp.]
GLLESGALFALLLASYALVNLPVNAWAVVVMILGIVPLFLALRRKQGSQGWLLVLAGSPLVFIGSISLFPAPEGRPAVA